MRTPAPATARWGMLVLVAAFVLTPLPLVAANKDEEVTLLETYCFDCHDGDSEKGDLNMVDLIDQGSFDGSLLFENLATGKMPPEGKRRPSEEEQGKLLRWLAEFQPPVSHPAYRRISRHEFVHSINDLLGTELAMAEQIPEDRGTKAFDSDRGIVLSKEMLAAYFQVADEMLNFAFPAEGFPEERIWVTDKIKDSHQTYEIYVRPYEEGLLFSWTRANNGNGYSFFYDNFDPSAAGWYELTFDAAKVGAFDEHISLQVYAGKYYFADDRPQPQRLLDVISLGSGELESHTVRAFLHPGENVSVHCYSPHNFREKAPERGAYIKHLRARGPIYDPWPPASFRTVLADLPLDAPPRSATPRTATQTRLEQIGGAISVSSFQEGMEKEKMLDGSNRTFWHTRFTPTVAKPPHYVILENQQGAEISGLSYATWSGGNGNGLVKSYVVELSDDGESWSAPVAEGDLETKRTFEQPIVFPEATAKPFIRFRVTDAVSLDGKSLASIGKLDVLTTIEETRPRIQVTVSDGTPAELKEIIHRFARRAFSSDLSEQELAPYLATCLSDFEEHGDFIQATQIGLKTILGSSRFLLAPGEHANASYSKAAALARILWLSVPDDQLLELCHSDSLDGPNLRTQIDRMLADPKAQRMVHSFAAQWLNLRSFKKVSPSLKLYPLYDDLLDHYFPIETRTYLAHLIQENLPVDHLIDSDFTFLNQRLAQHYGIAGVFGQELRKVSIPPDVPRGGLLTMGSVLKVTTDGYDTSPILRGAWISKNIVGTPLSPPPENVQAIEPDHGEEAATLRDQIEQHKSNKTCYACHKSIDPYGFALENFDATGQWRTRYKVKLPHRGTFQYRPEGYYRLAGQVDASGEIGQQQFDDIRGLQKLLLSDHRKVAYNFAKQFFEYANGYRPDLNQRLDLHNLIDKDSEQCRMKDLVVEILFYSLSQEQP